MLCAVDFCNRPFLQIDWKLNQERIGDFDVFLAREFLVGFSNEARINLHLRDLTLANTCGNAHHVIEAAMKALSKALKAALIVNGDELPTTKGML